MTEQMTGQMTGTMDTLSRQVADRLSYVHDCIAQAKSAGQNVAVVAVTKGGGLDWIKAAMDCGITDFGENYADELKEKSIQASQQQLGPLNWHFQGRLQSNKISRLSGIVSDWLTLDNPKTASKLARAQPRSNVFIEVRTSPDPARPGVALAQVPKLIEHCRELALNLKGLMCIASRETPERDFELCRQLAASEQLGELSLGMSEDFVAAVKHGSTMVRLGRILFDPNFKLSEAN